MAPQSNPDGYVLGLDVGEKRIGAAVASTVARLPRPLDAISAEEGTLESIQKLITDEHIVKVVVGIPRNLSGEETAQSAVIRDFANTLESQIDVPLVFADESLSSKRADDMASLKEYAGVSRDSLAACFILEEFFGSMVGNEGVE